MQNARTDFYRDKVTNTAILFDSSARRFTASATPPRLVLSDTPPIFFIYTKYYTS